MLDFGYQLSIRKKQTELILTHNAERLQIKQFSQVVHLFMVVVADLSRATILNSQNSHVLPFLNIHSLPGLIVPQLSLK